jgi:site-specific recombinase XerD
MLENWYKEKRSILDFRRGPLGPHFDGFSDYLKERGYTVAYGKRLLGTCCQFNAFLIEQGISRCSKLSEAMTEPFLEAFLAFAPTTHARFLPRLKALAALKHLFTYLSIAKVSMLPKPERVRKPYHWLLDRYLQHRRSEGNVTEMTVRRYERLLTAFLEALGKDAQRKRFKRLQPEKLEAFLKQHLQNSTENPRYLVSALRQFFRYCAVQRLLPIDFSGLIPPVRRYRHASLPKGMADSDLERVLTSIPQDTPVGARDYAILVLLMAYGIRGVSTAQLLLDDIDWQHSRIRIRAQKGGKEVLLPLIGAVGEAIVRYLPHRYSQSPYREVFLSAQAPFRPLRSGAISMIVHRYFEKCGLKLPGSGTRTFRHSWAIRALANDSAIKAIADVLGHRYLDTTFIYAKADLKTLRQVALPWPARK